MEIAVIDLDAALAQGSNESTIMTLIKNAPCRVGGGIRDVETALKWARCRCSEDYSGN